MLILVSPLLNSTGFLSSSIKFMLKSKISFKQIVLNENGKLPILFICFGSSKLTFTDNETKCLLALACNKYFYVFSIYLIFGHCLFLFALDLTRHAEQIFIGLL